MAGDSRPVQFRLWQQPKRGEGAEVCEDAAAGDAARGCFAIADGAAESADAARWARLLVEEFVRDPVVKPGLWAKVVAGIQQRWQWEVDHASGRRPWYAEAKRQQGAFATFLGLLFEETRWLGRKRWRALAVGDTCLFQVRNGRLLRALPVQRTEDFSNNPRLLGSSPQADNQLGVSHSGDWSSEDRFWLMTDALAEWFLREVEADGQPWETLARFLAVTDIPFAAWVDEQRDAKKMRNDDVTLLAVFW